MKTKLILLLAIMSMVTAKDLTVEMSGTPIFSGCNCKSDNNPNALEIGLSIHNPSFRTMQLSYEWYDVGTNSYIKGEKLQCNSGSGTIPPNSYDLCRLYLYTMMGGTNGSSKTLIKLVGRDGFDEYTKTFEVAMDYHMSPYEENVASRLDSVEYSLQQLNSELEGYCYNAVCCGMVEARGLATSTLRTLSEANASLRVCELTSAWNYMVNASNLVRSANGSLLLLRNNCSGALSLINTTGLRIASVADVVLEGKKCGADTANSESYLRDANISLEGARQAVISDDYALAFSKLASANSSILASVTLIGHCAQSKPNTSVVITPSQNETNQSSEQPPSDSTMLLIGGVVAGLFIIAAAAVVILFLTRARPVRSQPPVSPPLAPPKTPPSPPPTAEMHEDLEKEFNEWLDLHSQKK